MFAPLGIHSYYSLGRGTPSPEAICEAVQASGATSFAVTDRDNLYGLMFLLNVAKDYGLTPVVSAEITSRDGSESLFLFVMSHTGYRNLGRIITSRHIDDSFDLYRSVRDFGEGLAVAAADPAQIERLRESAVRLYAGIMRGRPNRKMLVKAREFGVPPLAIEDCYWIEPDDYRLHRLLRAIASNKTFGSLSEAECALSSASFASEETFRAAFDYCPEAVDRSLEIAEICRYRPDFGIVYPPIPQTEARSADDILREKTYAGALVRYGGVSPEVEERIERELGVIAVKGFAPVFLVVEDIVRRAPRTCGRGSAAASIVSYALGITHVEPLRHKLFFERFISPSRKDAPDIDIDFPWDERDGVLDYVFERYGVDQVAMVCNHNSFQDRAAIHETAKVFGLPEAEITAVTKKMGGGYGWLGLEIIDHPALANHGFPPPWPEILALSKRLEDIPRHLSVHCGGVVITPGLTSDWCPTEVAAKGVRVLHWEKDQTEGSGLVKIDLLGNRSLAVIRDASAAVQEHWGREVNYDRDNPVDDPATQALMASGDTVGVFYVESPSARMLQRKSGVGDYEHLVLHTSIIRPAANKFINLYLRRLKGESWEPLHPTIGELLDDNYGIMIYQEDITRVAMKLAGFGFAEADELRKILSQKHKKKRLVDLMHKFYDGAARQGAAREKIDEIWEMIMSFAGYSFCKPHSASYALVSFQSGWLKAHYPAEFIAAVLSNQGGYYATFAYVSEAKRMGLTVLQPDINFSEIKYTGCGPWVRIGLMQIKGISSELNERIVAERLANGDYRSLDDFLDRTGAAHSDTATLIKAGCFDHLEAGKTRPELLWRLSILDREHRLSTGPMSTLFDVDVSGTFPKPEQYDERRLLEQEIASLGFLASRHPLELYRDRLRVRPVVKAVEMPRFAGQNVEMAGWLVTSKLVLTVRRDPMEFVTFEDTTGLIETIFFPPAFKQFSHILSYTRPFLLYGKVEEEYGQLTLNITKVSYL